MEIRNILHHIQTILLSGRGNNLATDPLLRGSTQQNQVDQTTKNKENIKFSITIITNPRYDHWELMNM